jgi:hypothetical protein
MLSSYIQTALDIYRVTATGYIDYLGTISMIVGAVCGLSQAGLYVWRREGAELRVIIQKMLAGAGVAR